MEDLDFFVVVLCHDAVIHSIIIFIIFIISFG